MADNNDNRRGWSQIFSPVTGMLGLTDSRSERQLPAHAPQPGDEVPGQGDHAETHQGHSFGDSDDSKVESPMETDRGADSGFSRVGREARPRYTPQESERSGMRTATKAHQENVRLKDDEIIALREQIRELGQHSHQWEHRYRSARKDLSEARNHIDRQTESLGEAHRRCQKGEHELEKLKELLDQRTAEVKVAQAFMTTADKYSVAEVRQMVEHLNDEIYQCSMGLSDAMVGQGIVPRDSIPDGDAKGRLEAAQKYFHKWNEEVIPRLASDLRQHDPVTTLFDCVAQYALVDWVHRIIRLFCPQDSRVNQYLSNLWEEVATSHETSIARNWLAITCGTLKSQGQPLDRAGIMKRLGYLMTVSGREALPADRLEEVIGGKLDQMGMKALQIKEAITEGVLSVDIEVFSCAMTAKFQATEMRNAFANPGKGRSSDGVPDRDMVVCPTGLGLRRIIREPSSSDQSRVRKKEILLKTKVLLFSTLNE